MEKASADQSRDDQENCCNVDTKGVEARGMGLEVSDEYGGDQSYVKHRWVAMNGPSAQME